MMTTKMIDGDGGSDYIGGERSEEGGCVGNSNSESIKSPPSGALTLPYLVPSSMEMSL